MKKIHEFIVNLILLITVTYFMLKKTAHISISDSLAHVFSPEFVPYMVKILITIVVYSLIARVVLYIIDFWSKDETKIINLQAPHYRCLYNNNLEIGEHIKQLENNDFNIVQIMNNHAYEKNMQIIHRNFSEHLLEVLKGKKLSASDLFISLFHQEIPNLNTEISEFVYSSHYDPTIHETFTEKLNIQNDKSLAGIRAIEKKQTIVCHEIKKGNYKDNYVKGTKERRESIKHYIGIPLKINGIIVALLNIEFHNCVCFQDEKQIKIFIKQEIQAFTYLYEYQLYKRYFFHLIKEKDR